MKKRNYFAILGNLPEEFPWDYEKDVERTKRYLDEMDKIIQKAIERGHKHFITQNKAGVCTDFHEVLKKYGNARKLWLTIVGFNAEPRENFSNEVIDKSNIIYFFWNGRQNVVSEAIKYAIDLGKKFVIFSLSSDV